MKIVEYLLLQGPGSILTVVIEPQIRGEHDGERCEAHCAGDGGHPAVDGDALGEEECHGCQDPDGAQPNGPVDEGVRLEMLRVAENAHEDIFGADMKIDTAGNDETDESNAVGDFLDQSARAAE